MTSTTPTHESYNAFDKAYAFFNYHLFDDRLPPCLITLRRHGDARGYYWPQKFRRRGSKSTTDEIALNADYFEGRTVEQTLSTLVHEMAHLWQQHFGKPGRGTYHNKEWADKMDALGLPASATGAPGGKRTGQKVSHYIAKGGPFSAACVRLLTTGLTVTWCSQPDAPKEGKSGKRAKYECPGCDAAVWGKEGLNIDCADCEERMEAAS